jgi:hypothetical protein
MKKINLSVIICVLSLVWMNNSFSQNPNQGQGNQQWKINGNIADENYYLGTKNEVPIKFRTNDIERFRISPSGDFGIGTSTPESKLDVNGSVILRESLRLVNLNETQSLEDKILFISSNGNVTRGGVSLLKSMLYSEYNESDGSCGDGGVYNDNNPTWKNGLNKIFYKCPQIKVGIGLDNPTYNLHVNGSTYSTSYAGNTAKINQRITVGPTANLDLNYNLRVIGSSFLDGSLRTESISIGTEINPNTKLLIDLNAQASQRAFEINYNSAIDYSYAAKINVSRDLVKAIAVNNSTTNKENFVVYGDGTVNTKRVNIASEMSNEQVGTLFMIQNAERKVFQVDNDGSTRARKIVVDEQTWPDYVFEKNYNLLALPEVKKFIETNGHLPNVPSRQEIINNGVDLGEMVRILLEKVEELTLHTIQQREEIELLKQKMQDNK